MAKWKGCHLELRKNGIGAVDGKAQKMSVATNYTPNGLNQYTAVSGHTAPLYDTKFNLSGYDGWTYIYDADKRLISAGSAAGGGHSAQFVYDGLGRCVKRTIDGVSTVYTYDEWKTIVEWSDTGAFVAWNLYGPGADEILVRYQPNTGGYLHYHLDAMGNVQFLLSGELNLGLEKYTYDAFGQPRITGWNGDVRTISRYGNRFMFTGREYLYTLGIYDYRHRLYHPGLGRFIQTDPIGFKGDPMNLYRYCGGNPVLHSDPTGLFDWTWRNLMLWQGSAQGTVTEIMNPDRYQAGLITIASIDVQVEGTKSVTKNGVGVTGGFDHLRDAEDAAAREDYSKIDKSGLGGANKPEYGGYMLRRGHKGDTEYGYSGPYKGRQGKVNDKYRKMRQANFLVLQGPGALPKPDGWTVIGWHYAHVIPGNTIPADDKAVARELNYSVVGAAPPPRRTVVYDPRVPMIEHYP